MNEKNKSILKRENIQKTKKQSGENYLLILSIDKYIHYSSLNNAVKDAEDFKELLLDKFQFKSENTTYLKNEEVTIDTIINTCLLYTSPSPRDATLSRMPSSA